MLCFGDTGLAGLDPRHKPTQHSSSHAVAVSHIQSRGRLAQMLAKGQSFSSKKEEDWQWMLAQGQSASPPPSPPKKKKKSLPTLPGASPPVAEFNQGREAMLKP